MNAKILTVVIGLMFLLPAGYAASYKFQDCSEDPDNPLADDPYYSEYDNHTHSGPRHADEHYRYRECAPDGTSGVPDLVTGHTVYAKWVMEDFEIIDRNNNQALGLPTDFAAVAGYFVDIDITKTEVNENLAKQRECVVWFNGENLDQRPLDDGLSADSTNRFPSDEEPLDDDSSFQDYDFDRDVTSCGPEELNVNLNTTSATYQYGDFAVAVEKGDCNPAKGTNFRFRAHLDFVDPNGIYHEVQEYDYNCLLDIPYEGGLCDDYQVADGAVGANTGVPSQDTGVDADNDTQNETTPGYGGASPGDDYPLGCASSAGANQSIRDPFFGIGTDVIVPGSTLVSDAVNDLFPWTYTDPHNNNGCQVGANPPTANPSADPDAPSNATNTDDVNDTSPSADPNATAASVDLGHKCNGTIQDLFKERLWITRVHEPQFDETIGDWYTFAIMVDTCSGLNPYDLTGKNDSYSYPYDSKDIVETATGYAGDNTPLVNYDVGGAYDTWYSLGLGPGFPLPDACTDGSSFSFDDTNRGLTAHTAAPGSIEEIMRGNSFNATNQHREDCREDWNREPYNEADGGWPVNIWPPGTDQTTCYPEDHKTAQIDLYIYDFDPTGLFEDHNTTADTFALSNGSDVEVNGTCVQDSGHMAEGDDQVTYDSTDGGYHRQYPCDTNTTAEPHTGPDRQGN